MSETEIERMMKWLEEKGVQFEEGDDFVSGKYKGYEVVAKIKGNKIFTEIKKTPIKSVTELTNPIRHTVYIGLLPTYTTTYDLPAEGFIDKIKCVLRGLVILLIIAIIVLLLFPVLGPIALLIIVGVLLIGPLIVALLCGIV